MIEKMMKKEVKEREVFFCPTSTPSSKNGRRWTGARFLPSKATVKWREETNTWWEENKERFKEQLIGLEKPYLVGFHYVRKTRHKFDKVNPDQTIQDEMVKHEWIDDDNCDEMIPFPLSLNGKWYTYDKENPGAYIVVFNKDHLIDDLRIINKQEKE